MRLLYRAGTADDSSLDRTSLTASETNSRPSDRELQAISKLVQRSVQPVSSQPPPCLLNCTPFSIGAGVRKKRIGTALALLLGKGHTYS
jgi:hypothetical protein